MKSIFLFLLFVFSIVFLYGITFSIAQENEPAGQKIFVEKKCVSCHSVESADLKSKKKDAVDLSKVGENLKTDFIIKYLNKEVKIENKSHKTLFKGTEKELQGLAKWLGSLKSKGVK